MAKAKKRSDFHTPDGRIDADKALGFVLQRLQTMTPDEFRAITNATGPTISVRGPAPKAKKASPSSAPAKKLKRKKKEPV